MTSVLLTLAAFIVLLLVLKAKYGKTGLGSAVCRHCGAGTQPGRPVCPSCGRDRTVLNPKKARRR